MKLNKSEKTGAYTYELELLIEPEQLREAVSGVYRRDAKKYNVPGFRKGHAPRNLIEKMYGEDVFHFDAVNDLFPAAYEEAVKEIDVEPVDRPQVEIDSISLEDGALLKLTVTVKPEVSVSNYFGLKADRTVQTVAEEEVDDEIRRMRERNSRILTREGPAQNGDVANIDYEGSVDGVPFDGGKGDAFDLNLGSGQFIPGFEEQVVGHSAGETFDVNVTFPEEYHAEDMAGKAAVFKVKLNDVKYHELPELDDEFAKDVSEYDTLDELKKSIRDDLQKVMDEQSDIEMENQLVDQIVETIEGEIPDIMYENHLDQIARDFGMRLQQQGLSLENYLKFSGMDEKAFRDGFREQAEKQVKMRLALEAVVRLEGIEATEEDVNKEVDNIAERYNLSAEQVRNLMPAEEISKDLAVNKAIDLIKEKALVTEKQPEDESEAAEEAPAAKKPAAKKPAAKKPAAKKPAAKTEKAETEGEAEATEVK